MAKKYRTPILLETPDPNDDTSGNVTIRAIHEIKDDISTSFVYGDDSYEEEYVVPGIVEEIVPDVVSDETGE